MALDMVQLISAQLKRETVQYCNVIGKLLPSNLATIRNLMIIITLTTTFKRRSKQSQPISIQGTILQTLMYIFAFGLLIILFKQLETLK